MNGVIVAEPIVIADVNSNLLSITSTGSAHVILTSTGTIQTTSVPPSDVVVTGTIVTSGGSVQIAVAGYPSRGIVISGTWVATLVCETSSDNGITWSASTVRFGTLLASEGIVIPTIYNTITVNGSYKPNNTGGITHLRIRASSFTSGIVSVLIVNSMAPHTFTFGQQSIVQNVIILLHNSSTTNLAAGSVFTGLAESTGGVNSIQVSLKSSEEIHIEVQQSNDGINWDVSDKYVIERGIGDSRTVQATGMYVRVVATNIARKATDYFRLQTVLCPVVEALPRALTSKGNLKVAIAENYPYVMEANEGKLYMSDNGTQQILKAILRELEMMNEYMSILTDNPIRRADILKD